jgi:hypothetical protein
MADAVKDGAGNTIIPASAAGNRGMDPQTPLYVRSVSSSGADVGASPSTPAAQSAAVNSGTTTTDASGALVAAAAGVQMIAANAGRQLLIVTNTGANAMQIRFGAAPTATVGHTIAAGASFTFDSKCPTAAVFGFSTAGTTWFATTG